jgi:enoyl-CoA hydratase/carnithine racemase
MSLAERWTESEQGVEGNVYRIRLCRPDKMNALTPNLYGEIRAGVLAGTGHPDVRSIVIEGSGGSFAAGGDLKVFLDLLALPPDERMVAFNDGFDVPLPFQTILDCPKPVIAKIDGYCLAGGTIIAAAADIAIASDRAIFGIPEGRVGQADPFAATLLPAAIGLSRARYLMLTGRRIDARTACDWGLVAQVVAPEALEDEVLAVAADIARLSPEALRGYKRASVRPLQRMNPLEIMEAALSANGTEGLSAFSAKRPPEWGSSIYPV